MKYVPHTHPRTQDKYTFSSRGKKSLLVNEKYFFSQVDEHRNGKMIGAKKLCHFLLLLLILAKSKGKFYSLNLLVIRNYNIFQTNILIFRLDETAYCQS